MEKQLKFGLRSLSTNGNPRSPAFWDMGYSVFFLSFYLSFFFFPPLEVESEKGDLIWNYVGLERLPVPFTAALFASMRCRQTISTKIIIPKG